MVCSLSSCLPVCVCLLGCVSVFVCAFLYFCPFVRPAIPFMRASLSRCLCFFFFRCLSVRLQSSASQPVCRGTKVCRESGRSVRGRMPEIKSLRSLNEVFNCHLKRLISYIQSRYRSIII